MALVENHGHGGSRWEGPIWIIIDFTYESHWRASTVGKLDVVDLGGFWKTYILSCILNDNNIAITDLYLARATWSTSCTTSQFSLVAQSCPTLCDPMNHSTPGLPVHHQFPELTQTHVHRVGDAIQPSHPLSSPSPPAPNPSQHQGLTIYKIDKQQRCAV